MGLRTIAIVRAAGVAHAAYTKDVSRIGMGFYSPVQFLPKAIVEMWVPGQSVLQLRVRRCRRLQANCFECGALFDLGKRA